MKKATSRHANSPVRQKQILRGALSCFSRKGFTETSIADICAASRSSTGSVYHHFKTKERLAAMVYLEGIRDYQAGFVKEIEQQDDPRDGVFAMIRYHLKWIEANKDWATFLFQKRNAEFMDETEEEFDNLNAVFFEKMSNWFQKHMEVGTIRRLSIDLCYPILMGPSQEYGRFFIGGKVETDMDRAIEELSTVAWNSLRTDGLNDISDIGR